jgi:hypothetical protein
LGIGQVETEFTGAEVGFGAGIGAAVGFDAETGATVICAAGTGAPGEEGLEEIGFRKRKHKNCKNGGRGQVE